MTIIARIALYIPLALCANIAIAQTYPFKTIRYVVPYGTGGTSDITARLVAEKLGAALGVTVMVDNRPGAGGNIGAELVAKAAPDGYTLVGGFAFLATSPSLYAKLSYEPLKDLAPVILMSAAPQVLVVHPSLPAKTVKEVIALAKRRPGELNFPSFGNGSSSHLSGELFKSMAGVDMLHVPYANGMQGVLDLVSGRMSLMFNVVTEMMPFIPQLRGIAVTSLKRSHLLPHLPTVDESGLPGFTITAWQGVMAPAKTSPEVIARLNGEIARVLQAPAMRKRMEELGLDIIASTPEQFAQHLRAETDKWAKVIKASGISLQ